MDTTSTGNARDPVVVSGIGWEVSTTSWKILTDRDPSSAIAGSSSSMLVHDADPIEFLPNRKALKFMSRQDRLAVAAAGRALVDAGLIGSPDTDSIDVSLCVGYIPFSREEAAILSAGSRDDDGHFSMALFSTEAYQAINPIRAFTCLPNMSAHHIAASFGLQGEYLITYPGTAQMYLALQEAIHRLMELNASRILLGGIADQSNFLVALHHEKRASGKSTRPLADGAAFLVLERLSTVLERNRIPRCHVELAGLSNRERFFEPAGLNPEADQNCPSRVSDDSIPDFGAADLPLRVATFLAGKEMLFHHYGPAGCGFTSTWKRESS